MDQLRNVAVVLQKGLGSNVIEAGTAAGRVSLYKGRATPTEPITEQTRTGGRPQPRRNVGLVWNIANMPSPHLRALAALTCSRDPAASVHIAKVRRIARRLQFRRDSRRLGI